MISRRRLLVFLGFLGLASTAACFDDEEPLPPNTLTSSAPPPSALPPHCEALSLVWSRQAEQIKAAELRHANAEQSKGKESVDTEGRWWFDAQTRNWEVVRPVEPGGVDSRHWFTVRYLINGQEVASWSVDTREKTVSVSK